MSRVLLLMTTQSYRASAFIDAARRIGADLVVGGERAQVLAPANPEGHLTLDFLDPERAERAIAAFAREHPIDAVIAADDEGAILAARVARALGLRHNTPESVATVRDKFRMRQMLSKAGLPSPRFDRIRIGDDPTAAADRVGYPCMVKPLFLSGSRGVIRANDPIQLEQACRRLTGILREPAVSRLGGEAAQWILMESYGPGIEVALEGLLDRGRLRTLAIFDKPDPLEGPFFEETLYVTPSRLPSHDQDAVFRMTEEVVGAVGLREGPIHAELRLGEGEPWIVEIAPRSIGGLCSRALRFGDGVSLEELILRQALGQDTAALEREPAAAGVMMIPIPRGGVLRGVVGKGRAEAVEGIEEIRITIPIGQPLIPLPEGSRYLGFLFARGNTAAEVEAALRQAHRHLDFEVDPVHEVSTKP